MEKGFFKIGKQRDDRMDAGPAEDRHEELEKGKRTRDPPFGGPFHVGDPQAFRAGNGEGVHSKAHAKQYAADDECEYHVHGQ